MPSATRTQRIHLLVLETDTPLPKIYKERGSFADIFGELFDKAGKALKPPVQVETSSYYVVGDEAEYPESLEGVDAILLTGSKFDAHGNDDWIHKLISFTRDVWQNHPEIKFSGVCFGHQLLSRMLGGKVSPAKEWELSLTTITLTDEGKSLFDTTESSIRLHQMHKDQVTSAPKEAHIWGSSEHTEIQGLVIPGRLFTTQGHLGYNEKTVRENIDHRKEKGMVDEDVAHEAHKTAHMEHDGERVAAAILRFLADRETGELGQETRENEEQVQ